MSIRFILIVAISVFGVIAANSLARAAPQSGEVVSEIRRLLVSTESETTVQTDLRRLQLIHILRTTKELSEKDAVTLAAHVNAVLDDKRITSHVQLYSDAALVAGQLRLTDCVKSLVQRITLPGVQEPQIGRIRSSAISGNNPAMAALVSIGKPAVPAILQLAAKADATEIERLAAGRLLQQIERTKAHDVVNEFIKGSKDPISTRRMLEREPFVNAWKSD